MAEVKETPPYKEVPAAVIGSGTVQPATLNYSQAVVPPEDANDFPIAIKASSLKRWRTSLSKISHTPFTWSELFLAISTLCLGGFTSLWFVPDTAFNGPGKTWVIILLFGIGIGCLVAYFFSRKISIIRADQIAKEVLDDMTDPNNFPGMTADQRMMAKYESK